MSSDEPSSIVVAAGRGRGRGGGVPLMPQGMWATLNRDDDAEPDPELSDPTGRFDDDANMDDKVQDQSSTLPAMPGEFGRPASFGGTGGRDGHLSFRRGSNAGNERLQRREKGPPGLVLNAKGVDWNCEKCGNVNWSWRTQCNACSHPKSIVIMVCLLYTCVYMTLFIEHSKKYSMRI